jgi:hypothetical protein
VESEREECSIWSKAAAYFIADRVIAKSNVEFLKVTHDTVVIYAVSTGLNIRSSFKDVALIVARG